MQAIDVEHSDCDTNGAGMKTVLVTGASGYVGRHVVQSLEKVGARVISLDYQSQSSETSSGVRRVVADIMDSDFDLRTVVGELPDACLHLAWRNGFQHNAPSHMLDLSGHFRFVDHLISSGVKQIAVMGSMHEVGYWEGPIVEDTPCNPQSLYGVAKDALRRSSFLRAEGSGVDIMWLRGYYIYGDDAASQSIFGKLMRADAAGDKTFPFTSGKNKYDFLHVEELGKQIAACLMQDEMAGIINCCSGEPCSLAEQVESFIAENKLSIKLDYGAFPDRLYDSPEVWGDASKIKRILKRQ